MMSPTKKWYLSKTFWFNVLGITVAVLDYFDKLNIGGETIGTVLAVGNIILRYLTTQPITFSGKAQKEI